MPQYRITGGPDGKAGLDYKSKRAEVGDVVDDLPRESIKWLREQGYIEPAGKATESPAEESVEAEATEAPEVETEGGDAPSNEEA